MATSAFGSPSSSSEASRSVASASRRLLAHEQDPAGPIEGVVSSAPVAGLFVLHPPTHGVEAAVGQGDGMEGVDHLGGFGQHDRVDRRVGGRHVEGPEADPLLPGLGLFVDPAATST